MSIVVNVGLVYFTSTRITYLFVDQWQVFKLPAFFMLCIAVEHALIILKFCIKVYISSMDIGEIKER